MARIDWRDQVTQMFQVDSYRLNAPELADVPGRQRLGDSGSCGAARGSHDQARRRRLGRAHRERQRRRRDRVRRPSRDVRAVRERGRDSRADRRGEPPRARQAGHRHRREPSPRRSRGRLARGGRARPHDHRAEQDASAVRGMGVAARGAVPRRARAQSAPAEIHRPWTRSSSWRTRSTASRSTMPSATSTCRMR